MIASHIRSKLTIRRASGAGKDGGLRGHEVGVVERDENSNRDGASDVEENEPVDGVIERLRHWVRSKTVRREAREGWREMGGRTGHTGVPRFAGDHAEIIRASDGECSAEVQKSALELDRGGWGHRGEKKETRELTS